MAYYSIQRQTESGHVYGFTNFSTTQQEGQVAQDGTNVPLDSTIVWDITADSGYVVELVNFDIPNTTPTAATLPLDMKSFEGAGLPPPILGATMRQVSSTLIRVVLYMSSKPAYGITGQPFTMTDQDVDIGVDIVGCAKVAGEGVVLRIIDSQNLQTEDGVGLSTEINIGLENREFLTSQRLGGVKTQTNVQQVHGRLGSTDVNEVIKSEKFIMSYTAETPDGYRFVGQPTLDFNVVDYFYKTTFKYRDSLFSGRSQDICGVNFDIYKKR